MISTMGHFYGRAILGWAILSGVKSIGLQHFFLGSRRVGRAEKDGCTKKCDAKQIPGRNRFCAGYVGWPDAMKHRFSAKKIVILEGQNAPQ